MNDSLANSTLAKRRQALLIRRLVRVVEHYRTNTDEAIRAAGFDDYQGAHKQVMFHLELGGNRITTLAERARISVQGYVERRADPNDGRAQIVTLSPRGREFFETAIDILEANEREVAEVFGPAHAVVQDAFRRLVEVIDPQGF